MARMETIPDYDLPLMTLSEVGAKTTFSHQKVRRAVRYGHLVAQPRASAKQPLKFRRTAVARWLKEGASSHRPEGFVPERPEPEALVAFRQREKTK